MSLIESNLSDHPEESRQLKEIIEEWANLKVEAFENRRSWVRATLKVVSTILLFLIKNAHKNYLYRKNKRRSYKKNSQVSRMDITGRKLEVIT